MAASDVIVRLRVQGQAAFKSSMDSAAGSVEKVDKSADKAGTSTQRLGDRSKNATGKLRGIARAAGGFALAAGGIYGAQQVIGDTISNAVNLGEQINKTAVVFRGPGANAIKTWSKTTASALGMSQRQALESAGVFGNMLVPMGYARKDAARMSQRMVELGSDMASFNNASPEETLDALRAGLAGESEPLRRFGVFLNDARLKQEAMNLGLYKGKGPLDAQAKAQATYALILKDTKDAQGDFARTSDSLANRQRILKAQYENVTATLGQKLLPIISFLVDNLPEVAIAVGAMAAGWLAYNAAALVATVTTQGLGVAIKTAFLSNPVGIVLVGLIALGAALVIAYRKVEWFRNAVNAAFKWIKTAAVNVFGWIKSHWPLLVSILGGPFGVVAVIVIRNFDKIKRAAKSVIDWIKGAFETLKSTLSNIFSGDWIGGIGRGLADWLNANTPFGDRVEFSVLGKSVGFTIPALAEGGMIGRGGLALVGERGPELVSLPMGAQVAPTPSIPAAALRGGRAQTTAHFYLDRRLIATAVATDTADRQARR